MAEGNGNGWSGRDPRLRLLRSVTALVLLGLLAFMIIDPGKDEIAIVGTIVGALLVDLGFEAGLRWPPSGGPKA